MKKLILLLCVFMTIGNSLLNTQTPMAIPYQAVLRDNTGAVLAFYSVLARFTLHDIVPTGTQVYQETQTLSTNSFGLLNANIGQGNPLIGSLSLVDWGNGNKYLEVEIDTNGGATYVSLGTTQLLSVPYALFAGNGGLWGQNGYDIFNTNTGNVGIGTTMPAGMLHIANDNYRDELVVGDNVFNTNDGAARIQLGSTTNSSFLRVGQTTTNFLSVGWYFNADPTLGLGQVTTFSDVNPLVLQRFGGKVGIGTLTPQNLLHLASNSTYIQLTDNNDNSQMYIGAPDPTNNGTGGIEE